MTLDNENRKYLENLITENPELCKKKDFQAEEFIFREGDFVEEIIFVKDGVLKLCKYNKEIKNEMILNFLLPGDLLISPSALLKNDYARLNCKVAKNSLSDFTSLCFINYKNVYEKFRQNNQELEKLSNFINNYILKTFEYYVNRLILENFRKRKTEEIVKKMVIEGSPIFNSGISQKDLASFFGILPSTLSDIFSKKIK